MVTTWFGTVKCVPIMTPFTECMEKKSNIMYLFVVMTQNSRASVFT